MAVDIQATKELVEDLAARIDAILKISDRAALRREYQQWFSQAQLLVSKYSPSTADELKNLYYTPPSKSDSSADVYVYYGIRSYLRTTADWGKEAEFRKRFEADIEQQRGILLAIPQVMDILALDVAALVTADLVRGELHESRLLLEHGFTRAAGAVAGVALEAHLKLLHDQSGLTYNDTDSINPLASRLRQANVISLGDEKKCIAMADTRNKCDHKNKQDPTAAEVSELIDDVDRFVKRVQAI